MHAFHGNFEQTLTASDDPAKRDAYVRKVETRLAQLAEVDTKFVERGETTRILLARLAESED